jgi:hypothetical protein
VKISTGLFLVWLRVCVTESDPGSECGLHASKDALAVLPAPRQMPRLL